MTEIDTTNKQLVSRNGDDTIVFLIPVPRQMSRTDALLFAAWIVALAEDEDEEFNQILEEMQNT